VKHKKAEGQNLEELAEVFKNEWFQPEELMDTIYLNYILTEKEHGIHLAEKAMKIITHLMLFYLILLCSAGNLNAQEESVGPGILKYVRVYSDSVGETHFEDLEINLDELNFAPPAPPIYSSDLMSSTSYGFLSVLPGWESGWHPAPKRQFMIYLSGIIEAEVSDGEIRQFGPGSITLVEDTFGKGHKSKALGNDKVVLLVIQLE
jgi:hypothetical protein